MFENLELEFYVDLARGALNSTNINDITIFITEALNFNTTPEEVRGVMIEQNLIKQEEQQLEKVCLNNLFKEYYG